MKNVKSKVLLTATMAAVTTGAAATTSVHADTLSIDNQKEQTVQATSDLKNAQAQSRQNYATAKATNDQAQARLTKATQANNEATLAKNNAQNKVNSANDALTTATENQQQTKAVYDKAVNKAIKTDANAQVIKTAQANLATKQEKVDEAQNTLSTANSAQAKAQDNADKAAQKVSSAQSNLTEKKANEKDAQGKVSQAQQAVDTAKALQKIIAADQANLSAQQQAKGNADQKVNSAKADFDNKNTAKLDAKAALDNANEALQKETANQPVAVTETIKINQEWIKLLKSCVGKLIPDDNTSSKLTKVGSKLNEENQYKNDPNLAKIPVKLTAEGTLDAATQLDATRFANKILNNIRRQLGAPLLKISEQSLKEGTAIAAAYSRDNWDAAEIGDDGHVKLHYDQALFDNNMLESMVERTTVINFDGSNYKLNFHYNNVDELHKAIYDGMKLLMFKDEFPQWGHMMDLSGIQTDPGEYSSIQYDKLGQLHFNSRQDFYEGESFGIDINGRSAFKKVHKDTSPLLPLDDMHYDRAAINAAQLKEIQAEKDYAQAKKNNPYLDETYTADEIAEQEQKLKDGTADYLANYYKKNIKNYNDNQRYLKNIADAKEALNNAYFTKHESAQEKKILTLQNKVASAQENYDKLASIADNAKEIFDKAKVEQQTAKQKLQVAQDKLADNRKKLGDPVVIQANLDKAQENLRAAQNQVAKANETLATVVAEKAKASESLTSANERVSIAKVDLKRANNEVQAAQGKLDQLLSANKAVQTAKKKLNAANMAVEAAKTTLKDANDTLKAAQVNAIKAAQDLASAKATAVTTEKNLQKAKDNLITDAKVYGESVSLKEVPAMHIGDEIPSPEIANKMTNHPVQSDAMAAFLKVAAASSMDIIPAGTTAQWADLTQVKKDAAIVGNHKEIVAIAFPDNSTVMLTTVLPVLPATIIDDNSTVTANASRLSKESGHTSGIAEVKALNFDSDSKVKLVGTATKTQAKTDTVKTKTTVSEQLPQTGNQNSVALTMLGVAAAMFGFGMVANGKRRY